MANERRREEPRTSESARETTDMLTTGTLLKLAVAIARRGLDYAAEPQPGDLVVEITSPTRFDPDAIGWLVGHDDAPYNPGDPLDGSVPMREVWDIVPLNPHAKLSTIGGQQVQRWENAQFVRVPNRVLDDIPELRRPSS